MKENLEHFLGFYCKKTEISYKQGLNEIAAPFILLTKDFSLAYSLFSEFMNRFLRDFFDDEEFLSLQIFLKMFELLIKYHNPELHSFLKTNDLTPELFATPWFLTIFCSKMELPLVFKLWDLFLLENDKINLLFLGLALLFQEKNRLFEAEVSVLPQILTTLVLKSEEEVLTLVQKALEIKEKTPKSFILFVREKLKKKKEFVRSLLEIENMDFLFINPMEIMHNFYEKDLKCQVKSCFFCVETLETKRKQRILEKFPLFYQNSREIIRKKPNFLIIDYRKDRNSGFVKRSQLLNEPFNEKEALNDLEEIKGNYHMLLLGEKPEIQQEFISENVEFVSKIKDFEEIHDLHRSFGFEMLGHIEDKCVFCKKKKKTKGFLDIFEDFFKKKTVKTEKIEEFSDESIETSLETEKSPIFLEKSPIFLEKPASLLEKPVSLLEKPASLLEKPASLLEKPATLLEKSEKASISSEKPVILSEKPQFLVEDSNSQPENKLKKPQNTVFFKEKVVFVKTLNKSNKNSIEKGQLTINLNKQNLIEKPIIPEYQQYIEPKAFPLLKTNKENYFSQFTSKNSEIVKEKLKTTVFSNKKALKYNKTGLLHSISLITIEEKESLKKYLENTSFSYFLCRKIKEKSPGNYSFRNSILFISKTAIFCMNFEKTLLKIAEKASNNNKLKNHKKTNEIDGLFQAKSFKIKAFFPVKTLFKISSKKINCSILSFYFNMPLYEKIQSEYKEYASFLEKSEVFKSNKENNEILDRVFKDWHLKNEVFYINFIIN